MMTIIVETKLFKNLAIRNRNRLVLIAGQPREVSGRQWKEAGARADHQQETGLYSKDEVKTDFTGVFLSIDFPVQTHLIEKDTGFNYHFCLSRFILAAAFASDFSGALALFRDGLCLVNSLTTRKSKDPGTHCCMLLWALAVLWSDF